MERKSLNPPQVNVFDVRTPEVQLNRIKCPECESDQIVYCWTDLMYARVLFQDSNGKFIGDWDDTASVDDDKERSFLSCEDCQHMWVEQHKPESPERCSHRYGRTNFDQVMTQFEQVSRCQWGADPITNVEISHGPNEQLYQSLMLGKQPYIEVSCFLSPEREDENGVNVINTTPWPWLLILDNEYKVLGCICVERRVK